jgi:carboxymethylenebutenolidase
LIVYPSGDAPTAVVLLLHNELGLDSLQQALALQLAHHGFIAVAPDLLSGLGTDGGHYDSFAFPDAALRAVREIKPAEAMRRYTFAYDYARTLPRANGNVAALGSGLGGTHSFLLAAEVPDLSAAVVFYGLPPNERALANINAPVLGLYGGDDPDVVATVDPTAAAMTRFGKSYESNVYPGATHAFMTYVVEGRNGEATAAAWPAAIAFLNRHTR